MESIAVYIPMDRLQALAQGYELPERMQGAALYADISGFTPLTEALTRTFGSQRGAELITSYLNRVYQKVIAEVHNYLGSVISFSGDAITCWFDDDTKLLNKYSGVLRAATCTLAMQEAMKEFNDLEVVPGQRIALEMKTAVAVGSVRRFLVGDPGVQVVEVITGAIIDQLAAAEHHAKKGESVITEAAVLELGEWVTLSELRKGDDGQEYGVIQSLARVVDDIQWPSFPEGAFREENLRPWLLPKVYERLRQGQGEFLAELRPVIAMFVHFSGIDYEEDVEAGQKLDRFIRMVQGTLDQYEGTLLQVTIGEKGSFFYAAFGAPIAHEDEGVRAASAALAIRSQAPELGCISQVQIGISLGRLRAGAYGAKERRTYGVQGDDVNLAARLMQAASPGQILVSQAFHQTTEKGFILEEKPPVALKGKSVPVVIYSLNGIRAQQSIRLQEPKYQYPLVGRLEELSLVREKLRLTLQDHGQVIGISGEAGIGKSRLVAEIIRMARDQGLVGFGSECQSFGTNTGYLVWQGIWQALFNLDPAWSVEDKIQAVDRSLRAINPRLVARLPLLAPVLNINIPENELTSSLDAKVRKSSLEALLVECLKAEARHHPVLLVLENCHWMDPLSDDLTEAITKSIAQIPILFVMAYRPPDSSQVQEPGWRRLSYYTELQLNELTPQEVDKLIHYKLSQFLGEDANIPVELVNNILQRSQGNPFYIEELLNYLNDRGIDIKYLEGLYTLDLPTSLTSLILTRIDQRTESQKIAIKLASVIGRLFVADWLWRAFPFSGDSRQIRTDLDVLSSLDLTPLESQEPELAYLFKHIVTQEVAYESMPFAMREVYHDLLGQFIEFAFPNQLEQNVYLLAFHYEHSQNKKKKSEYLLKAGLKAQATFNNTAAIGYYQRLLPLLPPDEQVKVMLKLGNVLDLVGRWQEAVNNYLEAMELSEKLEDRKSQADCQAELANLMRKQGKYPEAAGWLHEARWAYEAIQDMAGVGKALNSAGTLAAQQGDNETARKYYEQSLEIRRNLGDPYTISASLNNLGIVARLQGDLSAALTLHQEALAVRREIGSKWEIATSLNNLGLVALNQGAYDTARGWLEEALAIQREVGDLFHIANAANNLGNVARAEGRFEEARALYDESLRINQELGAKWAIAYLLEDIGCLAAQEGKAERAFLLVGAASELRRSIGARLSQAELTQLDRLLSLAYQSLSDEDRSAALEAGRSLPLEKAILVALEGELLERTL